MSETHVQNAGQILAHCSGCGWKSHRYRSTPPNATLGQLDKAGLEVLSHFHGLRCPRCNRYPVEPLFKETAPAAVTA